MKIMNKIIGLFAMVSILGMCSSISVEAASGKIIFNDPTIAAGEEVDVTIEVVTYDDLISSFSVELEYDSEVVQFISGGFTQLEEGKLIFNSENSNLELKDTIVFRALKNQTTIVTISNQEVIAENGDIFTMREGTSEIKIEGGVEVEALELEEPEEYIERVIVQVQGVDYNINGDFLESKLPYGYEMGEMELEGSIVSVAKAENSDMILVYLEKVATNGEEEYDTQGSFFIYDVATGAYRPHIQIKVSDTAYIAFLSEDYPEEMSARYVPTTMTADGYEFVAWEDIEEQGYYIIYCVNNNGEKMLYRYDLMDQSYQRFVTPKESPNPNEVDNVQLQNIIDFIAENLLVALLIVFLLLLFSFILILTFGIKLCNRNKELDDIYTDAGILSNDNELKHVEEKYYDEEEDEEVEEDEEDYVDNINPKVEMLDDGLTQEFNINLNEKYFSENGFVDFEEKDYSINLKNDFRVDEEEKSPNYDTEDLPDYDEGDTEDLPDYDEDDLDTSSELLKKERKSLFGRKNKEVEDKDDDGFEIIEL